MKNIFLIGILLFSTIVYSQSQSAEDIFHFAGNLYVNGNSNGAKAEVDRGLSMYPNDQKLSALKEKIKEEEKQKQKEKQQNQDQKNQDQKDKDQKENKNQEDQQQDQQQNQQDQQQDQQKKDESKNNQDDNKADQNQQVPIGEISKEDAERLLKALEEQEKDVLEKLEKEKAKSQKVPVEKEW